MIEVRKYKKEDKDIWDNFIEHSKNSTFLFKRDFMEYHRDRFEDYSLVVFENNLLIAGVPAHKVNDNTIASHFGLTYGGFMLRKTETLQKTILIIRQILFFLKSNSLENFIYKSFPKIYNSIGSDETGYVKFLIKAKLVKKQVTSAINLHDKLEMSKIRRRYIKKAIKNGIVIKEVDTFGEFWNDILIPNLRIRHDAKPVHSLAEIIKLHGLFPNNIRQFNAYINGEIIAGCTIFATSKVARVQYNSANREAGNTGASDLLYSELINDYFKDNNYFDFGTSFDANGLNHSLLSWKESFGARAFPTDIYEIATKNYNLLDKSLKIQNVRNL